MNARALARLAEEISACRRCDAQGIAVKHSAPMNRGTGKVGMVVGVQPGRTEVDRAEAFSGAAGRRLIGWFIDAGIGENRHDIFEKLYFTSLVKCLCPSPLFPRAARNCRPFFATQLQIVQPRLLVTVGVQPLTYLFGLTSLDTWVGKAFTEQFVNPTLFPLLPADCQVVPLPHPSGLSRWLNDRSNQRKLKLALSRLAYLVASCP